MQQKRSAHIFKTSFQKLPSALRTIPIYENRNNCTTRRVDALSDIIVISRILGIPHNELMYVDVSASNILINMNILLIL